MQTQLIIQRLRKDCRDSDALREAVFQIENGAGRKLFSDLLMEVQQALDPRKTVSIETMMLLEQIIDTSPVVGGYLMACLYPIAAEQCDHHTYNAIELWMHDSTSEELAAALENLADSGVREALQKRYKEWVNAIRRPAH